MPQLPAADSGGITVNESPVSCGDTITFALQGIDGLDNPRVWATAHQNGELVWGAGADAREPLVLGGGSSDWVSNGGGPADCTARLYYILNKNGKTEWNGHGDQGGPVSLAFTTFQAV